MMLNYRFEIFPNEEQKSTLHSWVNLCRQQYNSALLDKQRAYQKNKKNLMKSDLSALLTLSKKHHPYLKKVPSQPLQETLDRLGKAFDKFFKKEAGYPKVKKHKDYHSITFTQFGMSKQKDKKGKMHTVRRAVSFGKGGKLLISKLGLMDIRLHRKLDGKVKQVIIKRQNGRWFAIFCVERQADPPQAFHQASETAGIDVGINKFAVLSNGEEIPNPGFLRKEEKKLIRAQKKLSRKKKGSSNWQKQVARMQKLHARVANQRKDFLHKAAFRLANTYSVVCVEDLNIRNLVKNRKVSKSIHDAGWGMFRQFLAYKCERNGGQLVKVKPHFTTQDCSDCGKRVKKSLSIRTHACPDCGLVLDRDHNAALNIEKAGLVQIGLIPAI
ncbi:transposase [Domibacillus sp. DTU_2020_1001157_1_SI_ALB_TIR_016]|uniref:RNA-guided endonuclease InsQ/TnpB family protein n=1 Tax=Domibacillus sp. DTU_2020_1001157_1_SI_ALB_TIR_016 TaxID=3077789 RepID=UPI0028E860B0|nr:transposase [Domibacillus sp. DTU_2020_1001157_1_SI_ALB_TIR_016]WNS78190.1 transposase [Domibacillus sp. DTU_2020_1001157_1_SI_ALB_TIR_016]